MTQRPNSNQITKQLEVIWLKINEGNASQTDVDQYNQLAALLSSKSVVGLRGEEKARYMPDIVYLHRQNNYPRSAKQLKYINSVARNIRDMLLADGYPYHLSGDYLAKNYTLETLLAAKEALSKGLRVCFF
jgi:hypothetical protein